ncbi:MAG: hypothetical protein ACI3Z9_00810 [Candidatus Onthomorpha sp.]
MLRYYSYYSVGGYKDFILGTNQSDVEATYYLPLLPILEERANDDIEVSKTLRYLKSLPEIKQLSAVETYDLPISARTMFSHAGYKLIYRHLEGSYYALALRDISNKNNDEHGRAIPFMFVITGDTAEDIKSLDILATYFATHIKGVEAVISKYLYMDIDKNGLKFEVAKFNDWINTIIRDNHSSVLSTVNGKKHISSKENSVALLVIPEGISEQKAITEQKLDNMNIISVKEIEILSKEDPERLVNQTLALIEKLKAERKQNVFIKKCIIAAGVVGFLLGMLICRLLP